MHFHSLSTSIVSDPTAYLLKDTILGTGICATNLFPSTLRPSLRTRTHLPDALRQRRMASGQRDSLGLPPFPRTQALSSSTFRPPPLDGSLTVPELYDWHYENSPHHPLFIYSDEDGSVSTIYWPEATKAVHRAGRLATRLVSEGRPRGSSRPVLAILAGNGTSPRADSFYFPSLIKFICD